MDFDMHGRAKVIEMFVLNFVVNRSFQIRDLI